MGGWDNEANALTVFYAKEGVKHIEFKLNWKRLAYF